MQRAACSQPTRPGARRQVWILKGRREEDEPYRARWEHGAHPRRAGHHDSPWHARRCACMQWCACSGAP